MTTIGTVSRLLTQVFRQDTEKGGTDSAHAQTMQDDSAHAKKLKDKAAHALQQQHKSAHAHQQQDQSAHARNHGDVSAQMPHGIFWIDDVWLTGYVAGALDIPRYSLNSYFTVYRYRYLIPTIILAIKLFIVLNFLGNFSCGFILIIYFLRGA